LFQRKPAAVVVEEAASFVELPWAQKCLRLAGTGRRIWELLKYPITREELGERLADKFAGNRDAVVAQAGRFLEDLEQALPTALRC
jgi:hypothetical protein